MKQRLISIVLIFAVWFALDMIVHMGLLSGAYQETAYLWRPMAEMKNGVMSLTSILQAGLFTLIYCQLVSKKTLQNGAKLGVLVGALIGVGAGLGSYAYMPISTTIAAGWLLDSIVRYGIAGLIVGKVVTKELKES